tara:strand:+ start:395 stop:715 length:321 start_codon:yes stop_codon:yes gene_type:complete
MSEQLYVWLDDERPAPPGWVHCRWPDEVIRLLKAGAVAAVSLDHDLGDDERGTGYDVVLWIEQALVTEGVTPPEIRIHTANPAARRRMQAGADSIRRLATRGSDHP